MKKVFILQKKQPRAFCTIISVPENQAFPISQETSEKIDEFVKISDVYFVFSKSHKKTIDLEKFTMAYSASGYLVTDESQSLGSIHLLRYLHEFFSSKYLWYGYTNLFCFGSFQDGFFEDLQKKILYSRLVVSIFNYQRISSQDISSIYMKSENKTWLPKFGKDYIDTYWTHELLPDTNIILLKSSLIKKFDEYLESHDYYLDTFSPERSFGDILSSWVSKESEQETLLLKLNWNEIPEIYYQTVRVES